MAMCRRCWELRIRQRGRLVKTQRVEADWHLRIIYKVMAAERALQEREKKLGRHLCPPEWIDKVRLGYPPRSVKELMNYDC
jgi:hypothetical protein